jgi:hypothetical protein
MNLTYTTLKKIMESTNRLPYTKLERDQVQEYLTICAKKKRDLTMETTHISDWSDGLFALESKELDTKFIYIKINAGTGIFGGQKSSVLWFIGAFEDDEILPGPAFNSILRGVTAIGNLYRAKGMT